MEPQYLYYFINVETKDLYIQYDYQEKIMDGLQPVGKLLIVGGVFLIALGIFFLFGDKIPFLGKLPGDILIKKKNFTFYFPVVTSILLSIIISLILYFFRK